MSEAKTWKDTVMTGKQIDAEMDRIEKLDTSYTTAELELCKAQAEITWEAREQEIKEAFKAGERKIVEWVRKNLVDDSKPIPVGDSIYLRQRTPITIDIWKEFLKSEGIE